MSEEQAVFLFFIFTKITFTLAAGLPNILGCKETDLTENGQFDRVCLFLLFIMEGLLLYIELYVK
jgi:hypothetical protein